MPAHSRPARSDIAIVGVGGVFPGPSGAGWLGPEGLWELVATGRSSAQDVPTGRWCLDPDEAIDAGPPRVDRVRSRRGCFVEGFELDAAGLDLDAALLARLDPSVAIALHAGREAYCQGEIDRLDPRRVSVVLAHIALPTEGAAALSRELLTARMREAVAGSGDGALASAPSWARVAGLPALLLARGLGLGGGALGLDAACASSLYAIAIAARELRAGRVDAVLAGGASRPDPLYTQMGFSQLRAVSARGRCAPFDREGDGLVVGEGAGVFALRRLEDAVAEGAQILGVVRGAGLSNDRGGSLLSPDTEGQLRAMRRAAECAGWRPGDVDLVECHATGTPRGDAVEVASLLALRRGAQLSPAVIGSVKSNVGHLLTGAGAAGLAKVLFALAHEELPPTANHRTPLAAIADTRSGLRVLSAVEPWPRGARPRRAAVSAFGFGGINAQLLIEEWRPDEAAEVALPGTMPAGTMPAATVPAATDGSSVAARTRVAITGLAVHCAGLPELDAFRRATLGGHLRPASPPGRRWRGGEAAGPARRAGLESVRGHFFEELRVPPERYRIPPRELEAMLPQQLLALELAADALADADWDDELAATTGVVFGIDLDLMTTDFTGRWGVGSAAREWLRQAGVELSPEQWEAWISQLRDATSPPLTADRTMGALGGLVASRIAREFHIGGPSFTMCAGEASGHRAVEEAARALQEGDIDCAVAGAVDLAGDLRALLTSDAGRPFARDGRPRPLDRDAHGPVPGEGGACFVLRRLDDARARGDRIYAIIEGIGAASGERAVARAIAGALSDADLEADAIDAVECHGSGDPDEDRREAEGLAEVFADRSRDIALTCGQPVTGHVGVASGAIALARMALGLHCEILPPLETCARPRDALAHAPFSVPREAGYWLRNRADGPRRAGVTAIAREGTASHIVLQEPRERRQSALLAHPLGPPPGGVVRLGAEDVAGLVRALSEFESWARGRASQPGAGVARAWLDDQPPPRDGERVVALVGGDAAELTAAATRTRAHLSRSPQLPLGTGSEGGVGGAYFTPRPLAGAGEVALVFPGSGSHYPGMGRQSSARWPELLRRADARWGRLRDQYRPEVHWDPRPDTDTDEVLATILGQVSVGALAAAILAHVGVAATRVIGYSLGETTALFATEAWRDRDGMLARLERSSLFRDDLAVPWRAARRAYGIPDGEAFTWETGVVAAPAARVRELAARRARVHLLIVNTPGECVIGGEREAVHELVRELDTSYHPLPAVASVHCAVVREVAASYHELHLWPTTAPAGVRFHGAAAAAPIELDRERAADSILAQAVEGFDFPRGVQRAYEDGVRIFLETGPGAATSRMIDGILGDRPHAAFALLRRRPREDRALLEVAARLVAEGVTVDLPRLHADDGAPRSRPVEPAQREGLHIAIGGEAPAIPPLPAHGTARAGSARRPAETTPQETAPQETAPQAGIGAVAGAPQEGLPTPSIASGAPESTGRGERRSVAVPAAASGARLGERDDALSAAVAAADPSRAAAGAARDGGTPSPATAETLRTCTPPRAGDDTVSTIAAAHAAAAARAAAHERFLEGAREYAEQVELLLERSVRRTGSAADAARLSSRAASISAPPSTAADSPQRRPSAVTSPSPIPGAGEPPLPVDHRGERELPATLPFGPELCREIAVGSLAAVLGPGYAAVDGHPTRVRLPDDPLLLVHRITRLEGEPRSLGPGRVVTEHDVVADGWYLDCSRIPTAIAVEAGQADLFLSGYLGIDFHTRGEAVYRLLDATVTFHDALPGPGTTIAYDIRIDEFFFQGETALFRFHFDATVDGRPLLTMRDGCAGFFTPAELAAGQGIVRSRLELRPARGVVHAGAGPRVPMAEEAVESYDEAQLAALRRGDVAGCFGPAFADLPLRRPETLPDGRLELVHRVLELRPGGGRYGIGTIRAEADIHPDDWFLTCHFCDDPVMPGTLMYECCLHTLRIYLLRMGWIGERGDVAYEPVPGVQSRLRCRGQVVPGTRRVTYEIDIAELGFGPEPYAIVDALMLADGRPVVDMRSMSLRIAGLDAARLDELWRGAAKGSDRVGKDRPAGASVGPHPALTPPGTPPYERRHILAFAEGRPSEAFGAPYTVFDEERRIARLPRPPYSFLDRVVAVEDAEPFLLREGARAVAEYDVPPDEWYFAAQRSGRMPFAVLLEIALQPCGWLAAYLGSALTSEVDMRFRNLGGRAEALRPVTPESGTLTTRVRLTGVAQSAGMIIQHYEIEVADRAGPVYTGKTYFGFFSADALAHQVGVREARPYAPTGEEQARGLRFPFPREAPLPSDRLRMVDEIDLLVADGGPAGLGFVRGHADVTPDAWYFDAHFYQDPVCPGSLGLEAFQQLLAVLAVDRWGMVPTWHLESPQTGSAHEWIYRGQVIPSDRRVSVEACVTGIDDRRRELRADGSLTVDGRLIYVMKDFGVRLADR